MSNERTELEQLGEFGLIKHLTQYFKINHKSTVKSIGDDAAILSIDDHEQLLVTTDMLVEGVHFDLMYTPLKHLGYKAVVVNLSDVYAMNATPKQITVSIAVSNRFSLEAIEELYSGIQKACEWYDIDLVGGDTTSSKSGLVISITAIGVASPEKIATRAGARLNDLIVVSGDLGGAYMGLQVLEREKEVFRSVNEAQPDLSGYDYILERQLKPEARKDVIDTLKNLGVMPTSMIDVSDGLSSEILHLCTQSKVGVELYEEKIPIDPLTYETAREFNLDPTLCMLSGGEDYELLFTVNISDYEKIKNSMDITIIGHITNEAKGCLLVSKSGTVHELKAQGWNALLKK